MAHIVVKINSLYSSLPEAEKRVADFVLKNAENVPFLSVNELSRAAEVSVASVSRLARKIGCNTFKDFKVELAQESSATASVTAIYESITPQDSDAKIAKKVFLGNIQSLEDTLKLTDTQMLSEAAQSIAAAQRVVLFGIGSSASVASEASLRFSLLDLDVQAHNDAYRIQMETLRLKKSDVGIGISHSGRSRITVEAMKKAQSNGAITVGISNSPRCPLRDISTYFFCTSFPEGRIKVASLSSLLAQLCLIDALYLLVAKYRKIKWDIEKLNMLTERLFQ
jgi:DNA-binding MurR/RpiR family transcriptional regulator